MTMDTLVDIFCYDVLRGVALQYAGVDVKARCNYIYIDFSTHSLEVPGFEGSHPKCAYPV
jgi:hypothetical protein